MRETILERLRNAKTEAEWNKICDEVKEYTKTLPEDERSGSYPKWWFADVVLGGLASRITSW